MIRLLPPTGQLESLSAELDKVQKDLEGASQSLTSLQAQHTSLTAERDQVASDLQRLQQAHAQLAARQAETQSRHEVLEQEAAALQAAHAQVQQELQAARVTLSASEDARIAAEVPAIPPGRSLMPSHA